MVLIASIPSPSSGSLELGPLKLNAYGMMIAIGVIVAVQIAGRRAQKHGVATMDDFSSIAMWSVAAGVVGARVYHVLTAWGSFEGRWWHALRIWEGGLGIWGGVAAGIAVGVWRARVRGLDPMAMLACAAPAIPVAQAIGRWGNWFNQELFGRPTDLPWALSVSDRIAAKAGYPAGTTFHPTFLYESIACLLLAGFLLLVERRLQPTRGRLIFWYAAGYSFLRFFIESLRIDPANHLLGMRFNQWVAIFVFVFAVIVLVDSRRSRGESPGSTVGDHE